MGLVERFQHDDIEGIRVGRFKGKINTTCLLYRLGSTLIDTGPPNQWHMVRRFISERSLDQVLVTHHHEDHSGNMSAIQKTLKPELYSPAGSIPRLADGFPLRFYQKVVWGRPRPVASRPLPEKLEIDGGYVLVPIHAPGHSVDMTCFLEPERGWLFGGDIYVSQNNRYLRQDEQLAEAIRSLRLVLQQDFDTLFCAHRGLVTSGKEALQKKLENLQNLCNRAQAYQGEGRSIREITRMILGREDLMTLFTWFHYSKMNLIRACLKVEIDW